MEIDLEESDAEVYKLPSTIPDMDLLLSISSGLGSMHQDEQGNKVYIAEGDCLEGLRDLQRFLRKDDTDTRDVFFALSGWDTARNDLLPIVVHHAHDHQLVINAFKVLTFLTMPVNPTSAKPAVQLLTLYKIKEAVLQQADVLPVLLGEAAEAVSRHPRMNEDHQATLQVCLILLRNLLAIPDTKVNPHHAALEAASGSGAANTTDTGANALAPEMGSSVGLHARLLHALMESEGLALLTAVAQHAGEKPFKADLNLLLEIVHELLRGVDPMQLSTAQKPVADIQQPATVAPAAGGNSGGAARQPQSAGANGAGGSRAPGRPQPAAANARDKRAAAAMQSLAAQEKARKAALLRQAPRLHSRDTGRFVRRHQEHNAAVYARAGCKASELPPMQVPAPTKGFKDGWEGGMEGGLAGPLPGAVAWKLRCWADTFTSSGAYNELMEVARKDAEMGLGISRMGASDMCRFMRITRIFSALARLKQEQLAKRKGKEGQGAHKEQPQTATDDAGAAPPPPSVFAGVSSTLGWPVLQLVLTTWLSQVDVPVKSKLKNWEIQYCCVSLLRELLMVLEAAQASGHPHDAAAADKLQRRLLSDDLKKSGVLPVLSTAARSFKPKSCPRGHAVDIIMCLASVVRTLDRLTAAEAGGFMVRQRKARAPARKPAAAPPAATAPTEPDNAEEGASPRDIAAKEGEGGDAVAQEGGTKEGEGAQEGEAAGDGGEKSGEGQVERRDPLEVIQEEEEYFDEIDHRAAERRVAEVQFDLDKRLHQELAQPAVIHFLVIQGMAFYQHNSAAVNKAVAALLWRIASPDGLNLEPMMYQLSVLRVMQKLLSDRDIRAASCLHDYQDLLVLATKVTRGLFSKLCPPLATEADVAHLLPKQDVDVPTATGAGKHKQEDGFDSELEIEDDPEEAAEAAQRAELAAQERAKQVEEAVERENKIRRGVSSMLFLDILFWKTQGVAEEVSADYFLRLKAELDSMPEPRSKGGRGKRQVQHDAGGPDAGDATAVGGDGAEGTNNNAGTAIRGLSLWDDDNDEGNNPTQNLNHARGDAAVQAAQPAAAAKPRRDLGAEHERLRKLHLAKKAAKGPAGKGAARGGLALSPELQEELVEEFQKLNAHKSNLDLLLNRLGDDWTKDKVIRSLRALGFKFGKPTEAQLVHLKELWTKHRSSADDLQDSLLMIAAELTGGWTTRQVGSMLRKNGIIGNGQKAAGRRSKDRGAVDEATITAAAALDEEEVRDAYARFQQESVPDMLQLVASQLGDASIPAVQYKLEQLGLIAGKPKRGRGSKAKPMVPVDELRELYEQHKDLPDMLNRIAASLSVPLTAAQVAKLLTKCDIMRDEAAARKAARNAADRAQLVALYQRHHGHEDYLQLMADEMTGVVSAQQVLKLMRKHGLIDSHTGGKGSGKRRGGGLDHLQAIAADGDDDMAVGGLEPCRACGRVPEPHAEAVLQCLAAIKEASGGRWMGPKTAVDWLCSKIKAAEALWEGSGGSSHMDYSLIMETDEDEAFFMTDFAQEFLEAAGIRNDKADYYKIPGNSDAAWRQRVMDTLHTALTQLETPQAAELLTRFKEEQQRRQERQEEAAAAAAERAAAVTAAVQAANKKHKGPTMGVELNKPKGKVAKPKRASDDGSTGGDADGDGVTEASRAGQANRATKPVTQARSPALADDSNDAATAEERDGLRSHIDAAGSDGGAQEDKQAAGPSGLAVRKTAPSSRLGRLTGQMVAVDSDSGSDGTSEEDSSNGDSDASSSSDDDRSGSEEEARAPRRKQQQRGGRRASAPRAKSQARPSSMPQLDSSDAENGSEDQDDNTRQGSASEDERVAKKSRTPGEVQPRRVAPATGGRHTAALNESPDPVAEGRSKSGQKRPSAHRPGTVTASARNAALAAVAAKRQQTTGAAQPLKPRVDHNSGAGEGEGAGDGGAKRRRLVKPAAAGQENAADHAGAAGDTQQGGQTLDDLEDF